MTKTAHKSETPSQEPRLRAALKWAGGKYSILPRLLASFPDAQRFIEPFLGRLWWSEYELFKLHT